MMRVGWTTSVPRIAVGTTKERRKSLGLFQQRKRGRIYRGFGKTAAKFGDNGTVAGEKGVEDSL